VNANLKSRWYALYTTPRAEKKVKLELERRNFECYLPLIKTLKQWSDRKKKVELPLFNSYIFVRAELSRDMYPILDVPGVVKFVRLGQEIPPVREEQIEAIQLLLANFDEVEVRNEVIRLKEKVEIIAGPLAGLQGIVVDHQGVKSFGLELEQLGCILKVTLPKQFLKII
jgi:transcription antitermination factor NusG